VFHVIAHAVIQWDRATFLAINHGLKCRALDLVVPVLTDLGLGQVQAIIVIGLAAYLTILGYHGQPRPTPRWIPAFLRSHRSWVGPLLVAFALSGLGTDTVKKIAPPWTRPWWFYEQEHRAGRELDEHVYTVDDVYPLKYYRFPSGHTATSVALATVLTNLYYRRRRAGLLAAGVWLLALVVALTRIYLGSHWPLDILGGTAFGVVSGWFAVWACRSWAHGIRSAPPETSSEAGVA
jgi:membrane-associated phospholipid phosphatase